MSKLVIVESPAKAKTIQKYLGKGYDVIASMGHVRDLPENRLSVDVKKHFQPKYAVIKGKEKLVEKLDELFVAPPRYRVMGYGFEIHEMTEMALVDFGQMAISNQPSFHIPFIYAALGEVEKTEYWVKRLTEEAFFPTDDGFPGDEDTGTTSAWYILSVLGMYRLCPGKDEWIKFQPSVKKAKILGKEI